MSCQLVETSEEDSFLAVARHIGDLLNEGQERTALADTPGSRFIADCETLLAESRWADAFSRLVSQLDKLFSRSADKDLECCVNIICHQIKNLPTAQQGQAATSMAAALTSQVDQQAEQRLLGLTELYNVIQDPSAQFALLLTALAYARKAGLARLLAPVVKSSVESWVVDWHLSTADARKLYLASAELLRSSKKKQLPKDAFRLTAKCLATFDDSASKDDLQSVKDVAGAAVAEFIRSPELFQFDVLESPAVRQLASDAQWGSTHRLLTVLLAGDLPAYEGLLKQEPGIIDAVGTTSDDLLVKLRLMALLAVASRQTVVPFGQIQAALGIETGEVEAWVVRAMGKKLLEGRLDQLAHTLTVTRVQQRAFSATQWTTLRDQLGTWKDSVKDVRQLLATSRTTPAHSSYAAAAPTLRA